MKSKGKVVRDKFVFWVSVIMFGCYVRLMKWLWYGVELNWVGCRMFGRKEFGVNVSY